MDSQLVKLWVAQQNFNQKVKRGKPVSQEYWAQKYLLGIVDQIGEVLKEIVWKDHRKARQSMDRHNVGRELADITKYVLSLWDLYDFTPGDMLNFCLEKTEEMEVKFAQEFRPELPEGCPVLITDVDGTLADWRASFVKWLQEHLDHPYTDTYSFMDMETELDMEYATYQGLKTEFEASGGYRNLEPFPDAVRVLQEMGSRGIPILAFTARPGDTHSRIWDDTQAWFAAQGLGDYIYTLQLGQDNRIAEAIRLHRDGHNVLLLEDNPNTALRAARAGLSVILRSFPYNHYIKEEPGIVRVSQFTVAEVSRWLW